MNNRATMLQVLQEFDKCFKGSSNDKYTKTEIQDFLISALNVVEKDPACYEKLKKKLGIKTGEKKDIQREIQHSYDKLSGTLRKKFNKGNENSGVSDSILKILLTYYLAVFYPAKLSDSESSITSYFKIDKNTSPPAIVTQNKETNYDTQYMFYFWNHETNDIGIGLIRLATGKTSNTDTEWESGLLYYFEKTDIITGEKARWKQKGDFRPLKVSPRIKGVATITIVSGKQGDKDFSHKIRSSFGILVKDKKVEERKIMMGSYSVALEEGSRPTSGIGVFVRIGDGADPNKYPLVNKPDHKNSCFITETAGVIFMEHGVPDEITNILFDRRDSLRKSIFASNTHGENKLFDSFAQLPNRPNVNTIKEISGLYFGYHLQNDYGKPGASSHEKGALRTLVLEIKTSGICYLLDDEDKYNQVPYFGFLSMKDYGNKKVLINLHREDDKYIEYHSWRLQFYLEAKPKDILEGIVSGFSKKNYIPITSPVRFKKVSQPMSLIEFIGHTKETYPLKAIFPSTFFKSDYPYRHSHEDLENLLEWDEKAIPYFVSIINNLYFNSPNNSLPHNFINLDIDLYNRFKNLIGNYYLVSCSHRKGIKSLSKVKVQLRNFGEALFIYPEESNKRKFDLFIGRWEMHQEGQLLKIRLKYRKRNATSITDVIKSVPQSHGDFIFQLNDINSIDKIDYLKSISVWVDYEGDNTMVAKREFLFPASDMNPAKPFPEDFIEEYQYKYPAINIDKDRFFRGIRYFEAGTESENEIRKTAFLDTFKDKDGNLITVTKSSEY